MVTFNQTDPLYVVDLSNPEQPVLAGQVSLSGYSSFLQPLYTAAFCWALAKRSTSSCARRGLQLEVFNVARAQPTGPRLTAATREWGQLGSRVRPACAALVAGIGPIGAARGQLFGQWGR